MLLRARPPGEGGAAGPREWHAWQLFAAALPPAAAVGLGAWGLRAGGGAAPAGAGEPPPAPPSPGGKDAAGGAAAEEAVAGLEARLAGLEGAVQELQRARPEAGAGAGAARAAGPEGSGGPPGPG